MELLRYLISIMSFYKRRPEHLKLILPKDDKKMKISKDEELSKPSREAVTTENLKKKRKVTFDIPLTECKSLHSRRDCSPSPYPAGERDNMQIKDFNCSSYEV